MQKIKIDTIIFDFDSTVLRGEMLEILAELKLKNHPLKNILLERIKDITDQGMEGKISFYESLNRRLQLLNLDEATLSLVMPTMIELINREYLDLLPNITNKKTYIISGGYSNIIHNMSEQLQITKDKIFAIKLHFRRGEFSHLEPEEPLIQSDGKAMVAKNIANKGKTLMIGDGMTDYRVKELGAANYFAAYTGVALRKSVCEKADFVINNLTKLPDLIQ